MSRTSVMAGATLSALLMYSLTARGMVEDHGCIGDWSQAARIVESEGLTRIEKLSALPVDALGGAIVRTTLCKEGDRYVYQLLIRNRRGEISKRTVDARRPFRR